MDNTDTLAWLRKLGQQLDDATRLLAQQLEAAARAKHELELAHAAAFLGNEGAVEVRKQQTILDTARQRLNATLADVQVQATTELVRTLRVRIEVGRSLNAAQRTEAIAIGLQHQ